MNLWGYTEILPDLFAAESFLKSTHGRQSKDISSAHVVVYTTTGGFGHGTFHDTVVQEMRKEDEQSPHGHWKSLPSLKMIKFI